jgi:hypothetical protein
MMPTTAGSCRPLRKRLRRRRCRSASDIGPDFLIERRPTGTPSPYYFVTCACHEMGVFFSNSTGGQAHARPRPGRISAFPDSSTRSLGGRMLEMSFQGSFCDAGVPDVSPTYSGASAVNFVA